MGGVHFSICNFFFYFQCSVLLFGRSLWFARATEGGGSPFAWFLGPIGVPYGLRSTAGLPTPLPPLRMVLALDPPCSRFYIFFIGKCGPFPAFRAVLKFNRERVSNPKKFKKSPAFILGGTFPLSRESVYDFFRDASGKGDFSCIRFVLLLRAYWERISPNGLRSNRPGFPHPPTLRRVDGVYPSGSSSPAP